MDSETVQTEQNDGESALAICRLCMSTESLEDVFELEGLRSWISDYLSIVVSSVDDISHAICTICRIRLVEFHQFRMRCQEVQATLWSMVLNEETVETLKVTHPGWGANKTREAPVPGVLQINGQYQCGICWKRFAERKKILDHRRIHGPKKYACMHCGKSYPIRRYLILHLRSHKHDRLEQESNEKEIACAVKNVHREEIDPLKHETFSEEHSSLQQEERKEEGSLTGNQTEETNIETTDNRIEIGHVKIEEPSDDNPETETAVSENGEFEPYADQFNLYSEFPQKNVKSEIFRSKDSMNTKVEEVNDENDRITDEINVQRTGTGNFEELSSRTDELMVNTQLKQPHQCNECGKVFTTKQKIKDHLRLVHGEKKHICPTCGKGYVLEYQLRIHVRTHDSATPFKCNMCEKSFKREKSLWHHKSTQHSLQQNCCPDCDRQFAKRHQLDKHLRSTLHRRNVNKNKVKNNHIRVTTTAEVEALLTDEGVYQCDICPKRFIEQQQIRDHKRLVHGERKLACPFCDKRYIIPSQFRVHVRTHYKPYRCDVCAKCFKNERTFWSHNRSEHRSEK